MPQEKIEMTENKTKSQKPTEKRITGSEKNRALSDILYLSSCAIHGIRPQYSRVGQMNMKNLYRMSHFHSMTNITFEAILSAYGKELPDTGVFKKWREDRDKAVTKNLLLDTERKSLLAWMEETGIWYMPLKGSILKDFYPKSGMRQMSDNDILFDAAYQEQVRDRFVSRGFEIKEYNCDVHDIYVKSPIYNFEMHRVLFPNDYLQCNKVFANYYRDVKRRLLPDEGKQYGYHFSDEDFYIYITAHAFKHYQSGGTGLRTLLDFYVYLLAKGDGLNRDYIDAELPKLELVDFECVIRKLAKKAFADPENFSLKQLSETEKHMLGYCLSSGTYGTVEQHMKNRLLDMEDAKDGVSRSLKIRYILSRLFPNREFMDYWCRNYAPFFSRHSRLMPIAMAWRLVCKSVTSTHRWTKELKYLIKAK